jgi:hypothetical protein
VGSLNGRISKLEGRIPQPPDKDGELRKALMIAFLDELSRLKSVRGHGIPRIGEPNIPPFDEAGETLGYPYTFGELMELAIRRVFERMRDEGAIPPEGVEQLAERWTEEFRSQEPFGQGWDKVEATGPPLSQRRGPGNRD